MTARIADNSVVLAVAGAAPMTINIAGYQPDFAGLILSMLTVVTVRMLFGFSEAVPGAMGREVLRTIIAAIFVLGYDLNYSPGPGLAVVVGAGVGVAIATILDVVGASAVAWVKKFSADKAP